MKRYPNWGLVPMSYGSARPVWPLYGVKPRFAEWSFGGVRPFGCKDDCTRWHAGIDLINAPDRAIVLAPERMEIVGVDRGWRKGSKAVTGLTDTGLFLVFGGTLHGGGDEFAIEEGMTVEAGAPIGRVKGSYGMIHFETYLDLNGRRMANSQWPIGQEPPTGLANPLNYVQLAAGFPTTFANWHQRRAALRDLGFEPADDGPWGEADKDALIEAQAGINENNGETLDVDGVWGPQTDEVIRKYTSEPGHENNTESVLIDNCFPPPWPGPGQAPATTDRRAPAILFGAAAASLAVYAAMRRVSW